MFPISFLLDGQFHIVDLSINISHQMDHQAKQEDCNRSSAEKLCSANMVSSAADQLL